MATTSEVPNGAYHLASPSTATMLGVVGVALLILGVLLAGTTHQLTFSALSQSQGSTGLGLADLEYGLVFGAVGLIVAARQPRNPMGWIQLGSALSLLLSYVGTSYSVLDYRMHHGTLPLGPVAVLLAPFWAPAVASIGVIVLVFPDGRLPSRRWRPVFLAVLLAGAAFQLGAFGIALSAIVGHSVHVNAGGDLLVIDHPTGGYAWWSYVEGTFFLTVLASLLAWFGRQVPSYRRSTGERRLQQKWLLSGVTIFVISIVVTFALSGKQTGISASVSDVAALGFLALPISIGIGILKFRLYDIDRLISRTLAYTVVSGLVVGVYVGVITLTTKALSFSSPVAVAGSTLAAVALFNPLRRRVQRVVDRRFNRARYDAEATVAGFTARLRDAVDLETVRSELLEVVNRAVEPAHASVWIRRREPG